MKTLIIALLVSLVLNQSVHASVKIPVISGVIGTTTIPATITEFDFTVRNDRIYFHWTVSGNQAADKFELESSRDGVNYNSKALVFGTDLTENNNYKFYLPRQGHNGTYRIRITQKDGSVQYHPITIIVK
ncbi:MAG: hypothetical protein ABWZ25_06970 [Chitinophagaceae bacterium]